MLTEYNEMKVEIKKSWSYCWTHYINMVNISIKTYEINGIETIVENDGTFWLNEIHVEEELDHKNLREITIKYHSDHRKYRYELGNKSKKQCNRISIDKNLAVRVIMDFRTTLAHRFRTRLGFK